MEERSALEARRRFFPGKSCAAPSGLWFDLDPFPGLALRAVRIVFDSFRVLRVPFRGIFFFFILHFFPQ
jgi:hypothetical protein